MFCPPTEHIHSITDHPSRVLVVDDLEGSARLAQALLRDEGHHVLLASHGEQALDFVGRDRPNLILMDVVMPTLDGFEVCRRLKTNPEMRLVPVVLLTALTDTDSRTRGLEASADAFISKPFNGPELSVSP
ncbi:MAG: response regulator [Vicinamibacterales bacterium]